MQLPKNSYSALATVLLAASAAAVPHPSNQVQEKRQYTEIISAVSGFADNLLDKVFEYLESTAESGGVITRQIQGKATDFACISGEKQVGPDWLEGQIKPKCADMAAAGEGTLVSNTYPNAMMSQTFPLRQDASEDQHDGDWVNADIAWSQVPDFNGEHAEMSQSLCEEIIQYGMDICASGVPLRVEGFDVSYNSEWAFLLDVTNIDDDAAEAAYGSG